MVDDAAGTVARNEFILDIEAFDRHRTTGDIPVARGRGGAGTREASE